LIAEGVWEGLILESPHGEGGFGYDPYFWLPDLELTAAQLDMADKNRRSHRGIALRSLAEQLAAREQFAHEQLPAREPGGKQPRGVPH
jgi:XTP/dITP diphosphohydrolase